ncbi:MAG: hypothetical protein ACNA8P_10340 [Phycisphaerales bacterium]
MYLTIALMPSLLVHRLAVDEWQLFIAPSSFIGHDVAWWLSPLIWIAIALVVCAGLSLIGTIIWMVFGLESDAAGGFGIFFVSLPAILALCIHEFVVPEPLDTDTTVSGWVHQPDPQKLEQQFSRIQRYITKDLMPVRDQLRVDISTLRYRLLDAGVRTFDDLERIKGASALAIEMLEAERIHRDIQAMINRYESLGGDLEASLRRMSRIRAQPSDLLSSRESLTLRAVIETLNEEADISSGVSVDDLSTDFETILNRETW